MAKKRRSKTAGGMVPTKALQTVKARWGSYIEKSALLREMAYTPARFFREHLGEYVDKDVLFLGTNRTEQLRGFKRAITADISPDFYSGLKQHVRADAEVLPFRNESFSAVAAPFLLAYTDREKMVGEMHRVLKRGGKAALILHHQQSGIVQGINKANKQLKQEIKGLKRERSKRPLAKREAERLARCERGLKDPIAILPKLKRNMFRSEEEVRGFFSGRGFEVENVEPSMEGGKIAAWKVVLRKK